RFGQSALVADGQTSTDFESWFANLTEEASVERRALIRPWFLSLHQQQGPVPSEVASVAWSAQRLDASERAVALTLADIQRTTTWQAEVTLSTLDAAVQITVEGHTRAPATTADPWDQQAIVCDIAEIIQEDISESHSEAWPSCADHGVGLHAEVQAGRAVWRCRTGEHAVSDIGMLGA
ncbi:MAG: hypothetical protein Q8M22_03595, partial [Actinomycetota bacterium]|nr:hypothetical protein [Actinomycetota bacterium]